MKPPRKCLTPYGGRLEWRLPGTTTLVLHMKDTKRVKQKKRWSQAMYFHYLLGYSFMNQPISDSRKEIRAQNTFILTVDGDMEFTPESIATSLQIIQSNSNTGLLLLK